MDNLQEEQSNAAWRPIETAPKDGTMIIAHNAVIGGTYVVGWDRGGLSEDLEDVPHWSDLPNMNSAESLYFNHLYFTHWLPLPPAPNAKFTGAEGVRCNAGLDAAPATEKE